MTARQNNNFLLKFFSLFVVIYDGGDSYEDPQRVAYAKAEKNKRLFSRPLDRPRAPAMMNLILCHKEDEAIADRASVKNRRRSVHWTRHQLEELLCRSEGEPAFKMEIERVDISGLKGGAN